MYTMLQSNVQYIGGVILLLLSTGSLVLSMDPLDVFADCVKSENIPPMTSENNSLLRTTFEIIQSTSLSETVLKCVSLKIGQLRNSSDTTEWFIGHTFDPVIVKKNIDHAVSVYQKDKDYGCLRSVATAQEQCFKNITSLAQQTETTAQNVCNPSLDQCTNITRFENECYSDEITIIEAATALFFGKCFTARGLASTTTTTQMPDGLPNSAFFRCGDKIFPDNDLAMLFPPSEVTEPQIVNVTAAKEEQKKSIEAFCIKVQEYSKCVEDGLMVPRSPFDKAISQVVDGKHVRAAFQYYCGLKELVTSNFECTKNNLGTGPNCYGGVLDILFRLNSQLSMNTFTDQCKTIHESASCRITNQLMPCSQNYADEMEVFYNMLFSPTCSSYTEDMDYGDGYKCFYRLSLELEDLFKNISGVEALKPALITAMRTACSQKSEWMSCLRNVHQTSTKSFDKLIFEVMIPDNIEAVADFVCSKVDDFDKHGLCVLEAVENMDHTKDNCILKLIGEISPIFKNHYDLHKNIPEFCGYVKPFATCGKQLLFDRCDAGLAKDAMTLGIMLDKSCHNPNPINGSSDFSLSTVLVIGMSFLLYLLDI